MFNFVDPALPDQEPNFSSPTAIVVFKVGRKENKKTFYVHKEHVAEYSPALLRLFDEVFKDGQIPFCEIKDFTPARFAMFVQWLYAQDCCYPSKRSPATGTWPSLETLNTQDRNFIKLWVLGSNEPNHFDIPRFQNFAMKTLLSSLEGSAPERTKWMKLAYEMTWAGHPLRKAAVDYTIMKVRRETMEANAEDFTAEMRWDVMLRLGELQTKPDEKGDDSERFNRYLVDPKGSWE